MANRDKAPAITRTPVAICVDCFDAIHFTPRDMGEARAAEIAPRLSDIEAQGGRFISDCGESYFSWSPCDCCNRPLGGMRHGGTLLIEESI